MYDMTKLTKRWWEITFIDGRKLSISTPKMNLRFEIVELIEDHSENSLKSLAKAISLIASSNKEGITISQDEVLSLMDEDEMANFVDVYTEWLTKVTSEKNL